MSRTLCNRWVATVAFALALTGLGPGSAWASTDEAWADFRADVERACRAATESQLTIERIQVDPFGSAHYGLAVISGTEAGSATQRSVVCVYDKHTREAEIGTPLDLDPGRAADDPAG